MQITYSNATLKEVQYMPLPDGLADVWLRKNIHTEDDEDGNMMWTAEEVYFRTAFPLEYIEDHFDELFESDGPVEDEVTGEEALPGETIADRVAALEAQIESLEAVALEHDLISVEDALSAGWKTVIKDAVQVPDLDTGGADEDTDEDDGTDEGGSGSIKEPITGDPIQIEKLE